MSLNTAIVSGRNTICGQSLADPISQFSELPMDVVRSIFLDLKTDLPAIALVCRKWKVMADDEEFCEMIRPVQAFGTKEWQEYIGVDAGAEPRLPRRAYADLEREKGFITFIPEKVKVTKESGVVEEVILDNLEDIGNLIKAKTDLEAVYTKRSVVTAISGKRQEDKPHWVWIKNELMGRDKTYDQQKELARQENERGCAANISGLIDTVITVLMHYIRYGEAPFYLGSASS